MFDFHIDTLTRGGIFFCALFYFFILLRYGRVYLVKDRLKNATRLDKRCFILLFFIFVVTSWTNGDWFHYKEYVKTFNPVDKTSMEGFYNFVIAKVHSNYLLFRCVVWGLATFLLYKCIKVSGVDPYMTMAFLFVIFIDYFDYSRAALGLTCYMLGLNLLVSEDKRLSRKLIALGLIFCSVLFHRSMAMLICLTPFSLIPINKKTFIFILVALFLVFSIAQGFFVDLLTELMESEDDGLALRAKLYGNAETEALISSNSSLLGWLVAIWKWMIPYVLFITASVYFFKYEGCIKKQIVIIYRFTFYLIALATMIYFMKFGHTALFYRVYNMSYIAISILLCYLYQNDIISSKNFRALLFFAGGYMVFTWLYRCYIGA